MSTDSKTLDRPVPVAPGPDAPSRDSSPAPEAGDRGVRFHLEATLSTFRRYPELGLLAVLLLLTSTLSRSFSQAVSVGPIYVTEVVMALVATGALARNGIGAGWALLRRLPLIALAVIWFVGALAAIRGLDEFGLDLVKHDIGLVDYTLLLPIIALAVVDRERHEAMFATLVACGFAGVLTFVAVFTADQFSRHSGTILDLQGSAAGLYMSFAVAWIAARVSNGVPTSRWLIALIPVGLVLMTLTGQRSVWMIALLSLLAIVVMAPPGRRVLGAVALAVVLPASLALAIGIQSVLTVVAPAESTAAELSENQFAIPELADGGGGGAGGNGDRPDIATGGAETRGAEDLSTTGNDGNAQLTNEVQGFFDSDTEEGQNIRWRLGYWEELVLRVPDDPIIGAGFGRPAQFYWLSRKYDFRDGAPLQGLDVAGPHNSFVNFLWRLGIPAFLALVFLIAAALLRVRTAIRSGVGRADRVAVTTLVAMLAAGAMASAFNEGLTGPFLGLFFWVPLGMLLIWPAARGRASA